MNSTLAGALAAVKLDIPIAHLEAGLRSYDNRMPEEHNRVLTDHLSSVLLVHSESALDNLAREGIDLELAHFVGNTMIDSVFAHVDAARAEKPWEELGVQPGEYGLVTLHRPALVDDPALADRDRRRAQGPRGARIRSSSRCTRARGSTWSSSGSSRACPRRGSC